MAISKILHCKDCGKANPAKHLKNALDYIMKPEKTNNGLLTGAVNCILDTAFEQMVSTKKKFNKLDKRQAYHIIISFPKGEVSTEIAADVVSRFVAEYIKDEYEVVYAIHTNTDYPHGHIIFNSVSCKTGQKFHYKKGDWASKIQPITNKLCSEYGLSTIDIESYDKKYRNWDTYKDGKDIWNPMIKKDIDACIDQSGSVEEFVNKLEARGYEVKQGKCLSVKPQGMSRFRRTNSLGENYSDAHIALRIQEKAVSDNEPAREVSCKNHSKVSIAMPNIQVPSKFRQHYFAKVYQTQKLMKQPYSQVWEKRTQIRQFYKLQEQYLLLHQHHIQSPMEVVKLVAQLEAGKKALFESRKQIYSERKRIQNAIALSKQMQNIKLMHEAYLQGDAFFLDEYLEYKNCERKLKGFGFTYEGILEKEQQIKGQISDNYKQVRQIQKKEHMLAEILAEWEEGKKVKENLLEIQDKSFEKKSVAGMNEIHI